jgi:catechol 2,3-dioxygenase-like lactoylglutathione lyase family enzyme
VNSFVSAVGDTNFDQNEIQQEQALDRRRFVRIAGAVIARATLPRELAFAFTLTASTVADGQMVASRPAITGISHMTLYADDLLKSEKFYGSLFGWKEVPASDQSSGVRFYANHLQYIQLQPASGTGLNNRLIDVGFLTNDAAALRRYLHANGVAVPEAVTKASDGNTHFEVSDPEGNKIDFVQAGAQAPKAPEFASRRLSAHIIHVGFVVRDRALIDNFYRDLLGFHLYWQGGAAAGHTDWVMMQVPDGTDWLEYMLYLPINPTRAQLASANHFSPGVASVAKLAKELKRRGWVPSGSEHISLLGVDGKFQIAMIDPDGTRAEFMEFTPAKDPCCAPDTGPQPHPSTEW